MSFDTFTDRQAAVQTAENHWRRGNLAAALDGYEALLSRRLAAADGAVLAEAFDAADAIVVERLADLALLLGHAQAADALLQGLVDLFAQVGNRFASDYISLKRLHLALGNGRLRDARRLLWSLEATAGDVESIRFSAAGLDRWEAERSWPGCGSGDRAVLFTRLYLGLGLLLAALGQYRHSLAALERGLSHAGPSAPDLAQRAALPLRLGIAAALLEQGNLAAAAAHLTELETLLDDRRAPGFSIRRLELAGKLDLLRGDLGPAREKFTRIWNISRARGLIPAAVRAALNLAQVLLILNQTRAADEVLAGTRESAVALGDAAAVLRADNLRRLAGARRHSLAEDVPIVPSVSEMRRTAASADSDPAPTEPESLPENPPSANYLTFFEDAELSIRWQLGRRDFEAARRQLARMSEVFGLSDSELIQLRLRLMAGLLAYYRGELSEAERKLGEVRRPLADLGLTPELWQVLRVLRWCGSRLGRPAPEQDALLKEADVLLARMTESLPPADRPTYLLNKWTAEEEFIDAEIGQIVALKSRLVAAPWFARPMHRWSMMKRLDALMRYVDRYRGSVATKHSDSADLQPSRRDAAFWRHLLDCPRDRAKLSFVVLPEGVLAVSAHRLSLDFGFSPVTRIEVRDLVRRWYELLGRSGASRNLRPPAGDGTVATHTAWDAELREVARQLAEYLQLPAMLGSLPPRIRALCVVPDDSLHGFPFAAILHDGRYLAERYAVSIGFERGAERPSARPTGGREALVVGVTRGTSEFPPLPGVRRELDRVESVWADWKLATSLLVDETATKQVVLDRLPRAALLHAACHGVFKPDRPDGSGLVLVPGPERAEILSLGELARLDLTGLQHATLSSCWSADAFILPGRWIIGLPETLWRAGARSVLASLWEVDDGLAVAFMGRFYDLLRSLPRDEALRRTQLECLRGELPGYEGTDTTNPVHWAGFVLGGDARPLRL